MKLISTFKTCIINVLIFILFCNNAALANVQNKIGDLGVAHGIGGTLQDGGFAKTALHAAAGGAFSAASGGSFTSGMIGGAVSEQVSSMLAPNDPAASQKIALVAQTASALAGGDASAMAHASQVATSGHEYNNGFVKAAIEVIKKPALAKRLLDAGKSRLGKLFGNGSKAEVTTAKASQAETKIASSTAKNSVQKGGKGGKLPVVRGTDGKVKTVQYTQRHHIVPQELKKHPLLKRAGVDIDDSMNLMRLPTTKGSGMTTTSRSVHQGRHVGEVRRNIERKMNETLNLGKQNGWSQKEFNQGLKDIIRTEYTSLKKGDRVLNAAKDLRKPGGSP
jgi:hypothetical protein